MLRRCHLCVFLKKDNQCHYQTNKMRKQGLGYQIITSKMFCDMRGEPCVELEEPVAEKIQAEPKASPDELVLAKVVKIKNALEKRLNKS